MSANERQVGGDHYKTEYQHWDFAVRWQQNRYLESQATKYLSRWRKKAGLQDLEKASHYIEKTIEEAMAGNIIPPMRHINGRLMEQVRGFCNSCNMSPIEMGIVYKLCSWPSVQLLYSAQSELRNFIEEQRTLGWTKVS